MIEMQKPMRQKINKITVVSLVTSTGQVLREVVSLSNGTDRFNKMWPKNDR